jgi:CO dehydrogenase maturation factor
MTGTNNRLAGTRIGIFGKGGCGKSTVTVLLAGALNRRDYQVLVLDADSTNYGLHRALGLEAAPRSLIDHFGGMVFQGGAVTCPVDDPTPLQGAAMALANLPEGYCGRTADGILLLSAGKLGRHGPGAGCDGPIAKIARDIRVDGLGARAVTLVDFKAGFEDSARGVITGLDWAVVIVDPTAASVRLAFDMRDLVDRLKGGEEPATKHLDTPLLIEIAKRIFKEARIKDVFFVLNRIGDGETERYLRGQLEGKGITPIGVIHDDPSIPIAWLRGRPLDRGESASELERIVELLEHGSGTKRMEDSK